MTATPDNNLDIPEDSCRGKQNDIAQDSMESPCTPSASRAESPFVRPTAPLSPTRPRDVLLSPPKPLPDTADVAVEHPYKLFLEIAEAELPPPLSPPLPSRSSCSPPARIETITDQENSSPRTPRLMHNNSFSAASPRTKQLVSTSTPDLNYHTRSQSRNSTASPNTTSTPGWLNREPSPERVWSTALQVGRKKLSLVKGNSETVDAGMHSEEIDKRDTCDAVHATTEPPYYLLSIEKMPASPEASRQSTHPEKELTNESEPDVENLNALGVTDTQALQDKRPKGATSKAAIAHAPQIALRPGHERRPSRKQVPNTSDEEAHKLRVARHLETRRPSPQLAHRANPPSTQPTPLYGPRDAPPAVPRHHVMPARSSTAPQLMAPQRKGLPLPLSPVPSASPTKPNGVMSSPAPAMPVRANEPLTPVSSAVSGLWAYAACFAAGCVFTLLLTKGSAAAGVASLVAVGLYVAQGFILETIGAAGVTTHTQRPLQKMPSRPDTRMRHERKPQAAPFTMPNSGPNMAFGAVFGAAPRKKSSSIDEVHAYRPYPKREILSGDDLAMD